MLVSAAGYTKPKLCVKRPIYVNKGTIYWQTTLKESERKTSLSKTIANASVYGMKEEHFMDDVRPSTFFNLRKSAGLQ